MARPKKGLGGATSNASKTSVCDQLEERLHPHIVDPQSGCAVGILGRSIRYFVVKPVSQFKLLSSCQF